ncbi:MAG: hypothetical protein CMO01_10780 [Thalassobius sp.]|nr:hypothetical protein [Thalassovita sp.]
MYKLLKLIIPVIFLMLITEKLFSQSTDVFTDVEIRTNNGIFSLKNDMVLIREEPHLSFYYEDENEIAEVYLKLNPQIADSVISIETTADFELLDSLRKEDELVYRMKVSFKRLSESSFSRFSFLIGASKKERQIVRLFPYAEISASLNLQERDLYVGEEKTYELYTDLPENIKLQPSWESDGNIKYRLTRRSNQIMLHLLPEKTGNHTFQYNIKLNRPYFDSNGKLRYEYPLDTLQFEIKESRLAFLNIDQEEIILETNQRLKSQEIQIDLHRNLKLHKTYRIEEKEQPGGALIAELFTQDQLSNGRMLCVLRVYDYHRLSDGYLYIKDGDEARFLTNFSIRHNTKISKVSIQRNGGEWTENLSVYPGEIIDVKVEGDALDRAGLRFEGLFRIRTDSTAGNENRQVFTLNIPLSIYKKKIEMLNYGEPTGHQLTVQEYQRPKELNFVNIDYGAGKMPVTDITTTIFYDKPVKDIVFSFDDTSIDSLGDLYGKQYLFMEVQVVNNKRQLIDMKEVENITICPGGNSLRKNYYDKKDCQNANINLNNILRTKTHELGEWSRIEITIGHVSNKYHERVYQQKIEIILSRKSTFDIDISFPAGLLTVTQGEDNISSLGGISLAAIAQFTFYKTEMIEKAKPYRAGIGILAFDAFNFSESATRYLALVALGSVYPINRSNSKLNFPLHIGGGYRVDNGKWFFLVGPGIRISF